MTRSRLDAAGFGTILRRVSSGTTVARACAEHGVSPATYFRWQQRARSAELDARSRVVELEAENAKLVALLAQRTRELDALRSVLHRNR